MTVYTSAWEVPDHHRVVIDQSVIDQMLLGNHNVYEEIQTLQDSNVDVEAVLGAAGPESITTDITANDVEVNRLRRVVCETLEVPVRSDGGSAPKAGARRPAIVWSLSAPAVIAPDTALDVYRPQIIMKPSQALTARAALAGARKVGAMPLGPPRARTGPRWRIG